MRMERHQIPRRILEWRPVCRRSRRKPRKRWIEDIEEGLRNMEIELEKTAVKHGWSAGLNGEN